MLCRKYSEHNQRHTFKHETFGGLLALQRLQPAPEARAGPLRGFLLDDDDYHSQFIMILDGVTYVLPWGIQMMFSQW